MSNTQTVAAAIYQSASTILAGILANPEEYRTRTDAAQVDRAYRLAVELANKIAEELQEVKSNHKE